jgi:FkbM family methyltransferase
MNLGRISRTGLIGKALRLPLKLIPGRTRMPIVQGRLRGKRWIVGSSTNHGFWLGTREYEQRRVFEDTVTEGSTVYDVGAHAGFYSMLAHVISGPRGKVIAFEPLPSNLNYLREHLRINGMEDVDVIEAAVSDKEGESLFAVGLGSFDGRLAAGGNLSVRTVTLDDLLESGRIPPPDFIKMDVEGGELAALKGSFSLLKKYHPTLFLATHGPAVHQQCLKLLEDLDYNLFFTDGKDRSTSSEVLAIAG